MTTCANIIDRIVAELHGWGSTQDRVTPLTAPIGATDLTFVVDFAFGQSVGISPGVVQIDSELLYVTSIDQTTNTVTVANGFGRGYNGTTAAAHAAGAQIVTRPKFPRIWVFKEVNEVINALYPDLFTVETYTGTVTWPSNTYNLGSTKGTPMRVIDAQWQDPVGNWQKCFSYSIDSYDGTFRLGSGAMIGRPLRVQYAVQPQPFAAETDQLGTVVGLPDGCADVIALGVVARQVPGLEISRAQLTSVEQSDRGRVVPPNQALNAAKYIMAEFQDRLANEAETLRRQYRPRITRKF